MENELYYVAKESDFIDGLIFECKWKDISPNPTDSWFECIYSAVDGLRKDIAVLIPNGDIRIKKLDSEDICSFGFRKTDGLDIFGNELYMKDTYSDDFVHKGMCIKKNGENIKIETYLHFHYKRTGCLHVEKEEPIRAKNKQELCVFLERYDWEYNYK